MDIIVIVDFNVRELEIIKDDRVEFLRRMRKLYNCIMERYQEKGRSMGTASFIARKVVFRIARKNGRRITRKELEEVK